MQVVNRTRGAVLAPQAEVADRFWLRLKGLMGRPGLPPGAGLVIMPCSSVHSFFMRCPIDVLHVSKGGVVLQVLNPLRPGRLGPVVPGSYYAVELPAGTAAATGTLPGDNIEFGAPCCHTAPTESLFARRPRTHG